MNEQQSLSLLTHNSDGEDSRDVSMDCESGLSQDRKQHYSSHSDEGTQQSSTASRELQNRKRSGLDLGFSVVETQNCGRKYLRMKKCKNTQKKKWPQPEL